MNCKHTSLPQKVLQLFIHTLKLDGGIIFQKSGTTPCSLASHNISEEWISILLDNSHQVQDYSTVIKSSDYIFQFSDPFKEQLHSSFVAFSWTTPNNENMLVFLYNQGTKSWSDSDRSILQTIMGFWEQSSKTSQILEQRNTLYELEKSSLILPENAQLEEILKALTRHVPESSSVNIFLHQGRHFQIWATSSELMHFQQMRFKTAEIKRWYYETFNPDDIQVRCFSKRDIQQHPLLSMLHLAKPSSDLTSSLYLPIALQGELVAILNLDSEHTTFNNQTAGTVQLFAPSIGLAVREHQNKQLLESTSLIDPLTGLENHKAFKQALQRETSRAQRYNSPFSLLILDLKDFSKLNKQLGTLEGDDILLEAAKALGRIVRTSDMAFRWGGDEFAVILPNTAYQGAIVAARRFARVVKQIPSIMPIKLHVGVATYPQCAATAIELEDIVIKRLNEGKSKNITVLLAENILESLNTENA